MCVGLLYKTITFRSCIIAMGWLCKIEIFKCNPGRCQCRTIWECGYMCLTIHIVFGGVKWFCRSALRVLTAKCSGRDSACVCCEFGVRNVTARCSISVSSSSHHISRSRKRCHRYCADFIALHTRNMHICQMRWMSTCLYTHINYFKLEDPWRSQCCCTCDA